MRFALLLFVLTFAGPLWLTLSGNIDFKADYRTANRDSAKIAPSPESHPEAIVQAYYARTFNWRGIFAVHTWIATKAKGAKAYTVYHVIGWQLLRKLSPVVVMEDLPDRNWFAQKPYLLTDIRGKRAEAMIPKILAASKDYPYPQSYSYWPGPNSNTFTAFIARSVPEMRLALPSNAVGKDYLPDNKIFAKTPSGTGYQISLYGVFGLMVAKQEGFELNLLGLVYGFSPKTMLLKLPGFGDINLKNLWQ